MSGRGGRTAVIAGGGTLVLAAAAGVVVWKSFFSGPGLPTIPDEYRPMIESAARTCPQLSVPLLAAQIDAESGWREDADSGHAQGISQFAPVTWSEWGRDGDGDGKADVWKPADAIPSQARYMCHLYEVVEDVAGDPTELALAAYNAGPNAVLKARGIPRIDETEGYVDRIVRTLLPDYRKSEAERASDAPSEPASDAPSSPGSGPASAPASGSPTGPAAGPAAGTVS
ncbi:lytic transglycosylase domain-containing protein [Streptomyces sp. LX-29]|uniref:lytic transglycosylase domain-containing protein n=1 Tax=Streptomyces sp. LX-29 TaxID=2900152 RepID=UPI00240DE39E|nr:lytic transglycosylase domain-containing protein [Streptomyces sp. LX-29]WFB09788.1 lytic transglycosylase domain-containing protein [Streptomyces sp. LX-29]